MVNQNELSWAENRAASPGIHGCAKENIHVFKTRIVNKKENKC